MRFHSTTSAPRRTLNERANPQIEQIETCRAPHPASSPLPELGTRFLRYANRKMNQKEYHDGISGDASHRSYIFLFSILGFEDLSV
jgi:hypothetical protein